MSQNLQQLRDIQQSINNLKERQIELQARGEELDQAQLDRLNRLESKEQALLSLQQRIVNERYRGNRISGQLTEIFSDQLSELASISSVYSKLTEKQKESVDTSRNELRSIISQQNASEEQVQIITQISNKALELQGIQQKLAETDSSKIELQDALRDKHDGVVTNVEREIAMALAQNKITEEQASKLASLLQTQQDGLQVAEEYATVSAETKEQIAGQIEAYDKMKKSVLGVLDTIRMTLQTPQAMIVAASAAAGKFATAMGDVNKQTGMFIGSTAALSFVFDDAAGTLSQMAKLSGDVNKATFLSQLNTNVLATSMGIGGEEAATLVNSFGNLQGLSQETGESMVSMVGNTARLNGVLPSQTMKDMAGATEEMALFSKGTGENFAMAAIQAAKLGVSVGTTSKMAENLLDFESSIEKELEASAMLGRDINLQKARELAYQDDLEGATKAVLEQVGGISEFNEMDLYQKKAVADALGVSVGELKQMVANQENLNTTTGKLQQGFGIVNDYLRAMGEKFGGPLASGVTFFVGELIRAKMTAAAINGQGLGGMIKSLNPFSRGGASGGMTPPTQTPSMQNTSVSDKINQTTGKGGGMNMNNVLKGAAAILILSAALYVAAKAFQEFGSVTWEAVAMGLVSLGGLAVIAYALGNSIPAMIKGAIAVAILGAALIPFAYALNLIAPAAEAFGNAISGIVTAVAGGISTIIGSITTMMTSILPLLNIESAIGVFALAASFTSLAGALGMFSLAGLAAIPAMAAVAAFSKVAGTELTAEIFGNSSDNESGLLAEIKALRSDLTNGKIAVYMDGQLVTARVYDNASKNPVTP